MTSTVSDETVHACPWGTLLAMAGEMAAGLAMGRSGKLVLVAGIAATAGIKWKLRRSVTECAGPFAAPTILKVQMPGGSPRTETADCFAGKEKGQEPELCDAVHAMAVVPTAESFVVNEEVPVIWEQGRNEPVSCSALGAQTVWFEMQEPMEAVPAVPALAEVNKLPESFFCEAPNVRLDLLSKDPGSAIMDTSREAGGLPYFNPQSFSEENTGVPGHRIAGTAEVEQIMDELYRGPHRSVVPHTSVDEGRGRALDVAGYNRGAGDCRDHHGVGCFQQDGWIQGLKRYGQVVGGSGQEPPANDRGEWATPLPRKK